MGKEEIFNYVMETPDNTNPNILRSLLDNIGGTTVEPSDVNFFDYDGTLVDSYTAEEFAALDALPENPTHEGLTAQGWNWSLSDAQAYVASYGKLNIGQTYITDDGKTRIHIKLEDGRLAPYLGIAINGSADVDWGDGSTHSTVTGSDLTAVVDTQHTYSAAGDYVIAIDVTGEAALLGDSSKCSLVVYKGNSATADENKVYQNSVYKVELGNDIGIGNYAFKNCYSLFSISIPDSVTSIENSAFHSCYSLAFVSLPNSVTSIGSYAFQYCTSLASVGLSSSVASIGNYAFQTCYSLRYLTIPDKITSIEPYMVQSCYSLAFVSFPNGVTSIGNYVFQTCYSLASITIPSGVTSIGSYAFNYCYGLGEIHFKPAVPPNVSNANAWTFTTADCIIYVPFSALAAYLSAAKYPAPATYTYMGFATYNSGETLPTQDSTEAYNVTWYATKADAIAQTNPITEGTGSEIYCRYAAV